MTNSPQKHRVAGALFAVFLLALQVEAQKFYPDDPLWRDADDAADVGSPEPHPLSDYYDVILHTFSDPGEPARGRAANVNTLGEVPDSSWFANRHGRDRMTIEELIKGPDQGPGPSKDGFWFITDAKTEGVTPGFTIRNQGDDRYIVKFDPPENPEMATAAEIVSTKFFFAMGYHVPENYLVQIDPSRLRIDRKAVVKDATGKKRPMTEADLANILRRTHQSPDGTHRAVASKYLPGRPLGPFAYFGTRPDDPNDIFAHENRRELRGLRVLASWLNHDDSRAINTLDMVVTDAAKTSIRHHLIDFGSTLGSGSIRAQSYRAGWEYVWEPKRVAARILTLGIWDAEWVRADYGDFPSVGRFESERFQPQEWKPEYPNPAFERATLEDAYWAAKLVMRFSDDEIRAIVRTGELSDAEAEAYLVQTLIERRDKIGQHWFSLVNTADNFAITHDGLAFERLASTYDFSVPIVEPTATWYAFDNRTALSTLLSPPVEYVSTPIPLPEAVNQSAPGDHFRVALHEGERRVDVYLRNSDEVLEIVGIERNDEVQH